MSFYHNFSLKCTLNLDSTAWFILESTLTVDSGLD